MIAEMVAVYHFGWDEILEMEAVWFCKLYSRIPVVDARRMLALLPLYTYPHTIEEKDRKRIHQRLLRQARISTSDAEAVATGWERLRSLTKPGEN